MSKPDPVKDYLRKIGAKGGKAGSREDKAAAGRKGAFARWSGHQAKRLSKKK